MKSKKTIYLTSQQLAEALEESQKLGRPTEQVCQYFSMIATHLLGDSRYARYPADMKEDMKSEALLKCIKNIKNYMKEYADKCFNYYTRCTEHAFWQVLSKHYKQMNITRELTLEAADIIEQNGDPITAQALRDKQMKIERKSGCQKETN